MKKFAAILLFIGFGLVSSQAQDNWKDGTNEINIGIKPFHFGPTSLQYKAKVSRKNWIRAGITDLRVRDGESGFRIGVEKQKNLLMRTRITYGLEPGVYFNYDNIDNTFAEYNVDLGVPLGVQIHLSKRILIGFESRPHFNLYESVLSETGSGRTSNLGFGLDFFNGIKTTLGYRF